MSTSWLPAFCSDPPEAVKVPAALSSRIPSLVAPLDVTLVNAMLSVPLLRSTPPPVVLLINPDVTVFMVAVPMPLPDRAALPAGVLPRLMPWTLLPGGQGECVAGGVADRRVGPTGGGHDGATTDHQARALGAQQLVALQRQAAGVRRRVQDHDRVAGSVSVGGAHVDAGQRLERIAAGARARPSDRTVEVPDAARDLDRDGADVGAGGAGVLVADDVVEGVGGVAYSSERWRPACR